MIKLTEKERAEVVERRQRLGHPVMRAGDDGRKKRFGSHGRLQPRHGDGEPDGRQHREPVRLSFEQPQVGQQDQWKHQSGRFDQAGHCCSRR